ncbi:hypothetical protein Tco_0691051 [Tanacetum coccineum]
MTGIPRTIMIEGKPFNIEHKLNEYSHVKPIKQNKRGLGPDRNMAACKETKELTKAGILWKVKHQTWVANPVMVKKSDGGWRMCGFHRHKQGMSQRLLFHIPEINWKINPARVPGNIPKGPTRSRTQLSYLGEACTGLGSRNTPSRTTRRKKKPKEVPDLNSKWRLYTDGASNSDESGAGLMLIDPEGKEYTYALRFEFKTTTINRNKKHLLDREVAKAIQDCEKCKEKSAIRILGTSSAIAQGACCLLTAIGNSYLDLLPMAPMEVYSFWHRSRTFNKVGRSQTPNHHKWKTSREVRIGIYGMQIQSTPDNQLKRRETFQRRDVRRPL